MKINIQFLIISHSVLHRTRNVSDKLRRENQNTHFMFNNFFFLNRAVYEIMWKNIVELDRPQLDHVMRHTLHAGYLWLQSHPQNM